MKKVNPKIQRLAELKSKSNLMTKSTTPAKTKVVTTPKAPAKPKAPLKAKAPDFLKVKEVGKDIAIVSVLKVDKLPKNTKVQVEQAITESKRRGRKSGIRRQRVTLYFHPDIIGIAGDIKKLKNKIHELVSINYSLKTESNDTK